MTAPARFYQDDVARLLKAYIAAGCPAPQIIVDPADYDRWLEAPLDDIKALCKPWAGQIDVEETDVKWGRNSGKARA